MSKKTNPSIIILAPSQGRTAMEASAARPALGIPIDVENGYADSNNALAGQIPAEAYSVLKTLDRLVGKWKATGSYLEGSMVFEWMEGGFFLIQHVDAHHGERQIKCVEYIGFDEDTQTLRSHYMDTHGSNFTYTWELVGDTLKIWFGDKGSDNFFVAKFSEDGNSYSGRWQRPGGGYSVQMTRVK